MYSADGTTQTADAGNSDHWGAFVAFGYNRNEIVNMSFDIDDVYIDSSWARIEIGDKPDFDSCTHREVQVPISWSDSSVEFSVNQGSFQNGDSVYLFVVDSDGNVSDGLPAEIGGTTQPQAPLAPVNLRIK